MSASETVDIDAMAFDAARGCFMQPCRCGDEFVVPERMLELRCAARSHIVRPALY